RLNATKTGPDGEESRITDKGTMSELRKKYSFLAGFMTVMPTVRIGTPRPPVAARPQRALGLTLRRPSKDLEFHMKLPTETSWIVDTVQPGSIGAKLGLKKMDLLTHADDVDLSELASLTNAKRALAIVRRGKSMRLALPGEDAAMPEKK
ncbi:MAG: hypothetical protein AAGD14_08975, partial [Planctomycetota bacterium]